MEKKNFVTYEYATKTVSVGKQAAEVDLREAFGWEATGSEPSIAGGVTLSFKRDRKLPNKTELIRLERKADNINRTLAHLEGEKTKSASVFGYVFGSLGALVLGGGMSLCMLVQTLPAMIGGIALGVVGIAMVSVNYLLYKKIAEKKTEKLQPTIEETEEKLAIVCEQAHGLWAQEGI